MTTTEAILAECPVAECVWRNDDGKCARDGMIFYSQSETCLEKLMYLAKINDHDKTRKD